jgi:hypothetical protein
MGFVAITKGGWETYNQLLCGIWSGESKCSIQLWNKMGGGGGQGEARIHHRKTTQPQKN